MVCTNCGDQGHNMKTCPKVKTADEDTGKRGHGESPSTPAVAAKIAKLESISKKMSPSREIPVLPGMGSSGSGGAMGKDPSATQGVSTSATSGGATGGDDDVPHEKQAPTNADIMDRLGTMMSNMVMKNDLEGLKQDMMTETKIQISEAVDPLKSEIADIRSDITGFEARLATMDVPCKRLESIEADLAKLKEGSAAGNIKTENLRVVVGRMPNVHTLDQAKAWLTKTLADSGVPQPVDKFITSDDFKGILCARCTSPLHRDQLISAVRDTAQKSATDTWAKTHQPIEVRAAEGVLFAFKRMLADKAWGYDKRAIKVDTDEHVIKVAGTEVLRSTVQQSELKIEWCDAEWEKWHQLRSDAEFLKIIENAKEKLSKAKEYGNKGKGKGPDQ